MARIWARTVYGLLRYKRLTHWLLGPHVGILEMLTARSSRSGSSVPTLAQILDTPSASTPTPLAPPFFCCLPILVAATSSPPRLPPSDRRGPPPRHPRSPPAQRLFNPPCSPRRAPSRHLPDALIARLPHATLTVSFDERDFVDSTQCPRCLEGVLPRVGKLEWHIAGVDKYGSFHTDAFA
ncbi:hypothetical protein B0H14DRAFT_3868908 [Mycena olivaceomarginata]|nr:hypothetical protein B0H14DRAFT_3868908 [Mycena olivaceomarginata]